MKLPQMELAQFKGRIAKGIALGGPVMLQKALAVKIEGAGDRRKLFTISTAAVDRDNDTISLAGWDLRAYMTNPVVLWGHASLQPPVGRSVEIGTDGDALKAIVEFVPADMPIVGEMADMVYRMTDLGFLSACSVGFRPLEYTISKDRTDEDMWFPAVDFTKQELLEWSVCTIPSNPDAVINPSEQRSIDTAETARIEREAAAAAAVLLRSTEIAARRRQLRAACF